MVKFSITYTVLYILYSVLCTGVLYGLLLYAYDDGGEVEVKLKSKINRRYYCAHNFTRYVLSL
jgi:hypothetical protein